ncbi:autotransporter domain-containing protein [Bradyrhizobium sp. CCBAU 51753]|uniref:autotransporter domain-containing protein n=1 Tax=Bradyrhizobium sp. CCBAU 51753 TaxID=1325100 RepID=UPI00188D1645|nr:autotransporter domain-containing protein [Bradyrhizobium sp. CCBAU 51753]QOZ24619.1 hypothetical protein XH93_14310 [Bradyrhizobium sp. CCBAU 51753]
MTALALCASAASVFPLGPAAAQSFVWGGTGSTTATTEYELNTNWSNPGTAPPSLPGQSAIFDSTGSPTINIGPGPKLPDSWTFNANSRDFTINGNPVQFSRSGPTGGLINNADNGQTITINANVAEGGGGPVMVQQLGNSTLVLAGTNSYTGGTLISAGTVQVTNANSVGTGAITLNGGTFQMQSPTVSSIAFANNISVGAFGTVDANGAQVNLQGVISDGVGAGTLFLVDTAHSGTSNVQLSGVNTYSGGTTVIGTTVIATNNRSLGTGAVTLDNSVLQAEGVSNLTFSNNFAINQSATGSAIDANGVQLTIAGNIGDGNDSAQLTVLDNSGGLGRVIMLGTNTYSGGTTICDCATLQLGDATHTASLAGEIAVDGKLDIVNANTAAISKIVNDGFNGVATTTFYNSTSAGTATIESKNFGITEFRDSSTAGNANVLTSSGALTIFRDTSSAGNAVFTSTNGGTVVFGDALGPPGGTDTATAGNAVIDNFSGSSVVFLGHTTAGQATITNHDLGTSAQFFEFSSAGSAKITNSASGSVFFFMNSTAGSSSIDNSGLLYFGTGGFSAAEAPTAGNATIINRSGSVLNFAAHATAGDATITTESGAATTFVDNSTGGNAQFITNGTGFVDFGGSLGLNGDHRITAGSIAGSGTYYIGGGNTLIVGGNNLSSTVSGLIADFDPCGCIGPTSGSGTLVKTGSGTLTLAGANTYTGGTTISGGVIEVTNVNAVSTGAVTLDGGTFKADGASNLTFGNAFKVNTTGGGIDNGSAVLTIAGVIANGNGGTGVLQLTGAGTTVLSGVNTYTGGTLISAGTVQATNVASLGSGTITLNGGIFQMAPSLTGIAFANSIAVSAAGGTIDANSAAVNLQGVIADGAGAGVLRLTSTGTQRTIQLSGVNTYTGGTLVDHTTVIATNASSVGTGTVTLNGGVFKVDGTSDLTFNNNFRISDSSSGTINSVGKQLTISGGITAGNGTSLTVSDSIGSGRVVLLGANDLQGNTTVDYSGALQVGDATHASSIGGSLVVNGRLDIVNGSTAGLVSITNDANRLSLNAGPGITTFYNATSAGNATITNSDGGTTVFRDNSSAGSARIFGTTTFGVRSGSDTSTAANAIIYGGVTFLANTNAGQATLVGGASFGDFASAGSATLLAGGNFNNSSTAANATIYNTFFTFFSDTATAASATIITRSDGTSFSTPVLSFGGRSTAGNAIIITESPGSPYDDFFGRPPPSDVRFADNATGGNAQFITNGGAIVDFGGSRGLNGDGRITAGSIAGSGRYYIGGGNTLVVGSNNLSTTVSGVIADGTGSGALEKVGLGTLTLSGANTYSGGTTINGGTLSVNGSIASSSLTTVNAGGTLGGNGILGNTVVSGGSLAPGNSIGTLTVQGNLVFTAAASYMVEVSTVGADRTNVTGTATLGGATVKASFAPGSYVTKQYTIISAGGGVNGAFSSLVNANLPANFTPSLSYDANNAYLNLTLNFVPPTPPDFGRGLSGNQQAVANTLVNFFNTTGGIPLVYGTLTPNGLTQASGEGATASQQATFNAMNLFIGLLTDPFVAGRDGGLGAGAGASPFAEESASLAYAARRTDARDAFAGIYRKAPAAPLDFEQRWSVWAAGYGGSQTTSGNAVVGSNNTSSSIYGTAVGADYRLSPNTLAGFALAGGGTNFSVNGLGWGRSDLFQAGAFIRHNIGAAYLSAALAYGWQDVTTDRIVTAAGADHLRAEFKANAWSGRLEGGYRYATPWLGLTPYAAGQFTTFGLPGYAETVVAGSGAFALNTTAKSVTDTRSELGLRADKSFAVDSGVVTLRGRVAWAHDFNPDRNIAAVFQALPGAAFVVNGAAQASDSVLTTASAEVKWRNGWSAAATFEGEFSNVTQSYAGKGVMRYSW